MIRVVIQELLDNSADFMIHRGRLGVVEYLLDADADINARVHYNDDPISETVSASALHIAESD